MGQTDDLGAFRIYGLAPGDYYVSSVLRGQMMMGLPVQTSAELEGYAPTYYPGTPSPTQGQRVVVRASQEVTNINFPLTVTRLISISGRVISSIGEPLAQTMVRVTPAERSEMMMMMGFGNAVTRGDGTFQVPGMTPGTYIVSAMPRNPENSNNEFGQVRVALGSDSIDNVLITMSHGGVLRGSITTDDSSPLPVRPQQANIIARPAEPDFGMPGPGSTKVNDDWTFEVTGLSERRILMASLVEAPEWGVKAILHEGIDVTDTGLEFAPGQTIEGVQVVFSRKRTELTGIVSDARGKPDLEATVVVFAQDSRRWTYASRYVRMARLNQDGRYMLRGLPPEEYFAVAVKEIDAGRLQDPEYLETLRAQAIRLILLEGEMKTQDLRVRQ